MTEIWDQLYDAFASIPDPRIDRTKAHSLIDIISIAICAVICGADSWVAVETFGTTKRAWLERSLALPNGIPSHDTFGRVFAALDATQFQEHFVRWVQAIWPAELGEVISIDGKTVCGSHDRGIGKHAIHMVSAWAQQSRLVLAQTTVDAKSNEITAIPALLRLLDLHGCTVTIDAMGTQTAIAGQIVTQGGAYVLAVKDNQEQLHTDIADTFRYVAADQWQEVAHEHTRSVEAGHGRIEMRDYWLITEPSYLEYINPKGAWRDIGGIGMVVRERTVEGRTSQETGYYLLSGAPTARSFAGAVRGHWGIENCVHWVLDVTFGEDGSRIRTGEAAQNFAVLRHIALNLLRREASAGSIATKRFRAALDETYLGQVLRA
jgi:predicted transposase YbfD/YdcC